MSSAEKYVPNYTVDDYQHWEGDWELWQGVAVAMTPSAYGNHSSVLVNICAALKNAIVNAGCSATVLVELDWIISDDTVLRPDAMIVREIYQAQSVPYYLIVDPKSKSLTALKLESATYVQVDVESEMDLHICETCHLKIPISAIFE